MDSILLKKNTYLRCYQLAQLFLVYGLLLMSSAVQAGGGAEASEEEYLMLPAYCRQQNLVAPLWWYKYRDINLVPIWKNKLGDNYIHIHHHCWAHLSLMRSYQLPGILQQRGQTRKFLAGIALDDFQYMAHRATPDWIFWSELHTKAAEAHLILQDERHAFESIQKSWAFDPTYWQAYTLWGQYLLSRGRLREALTTTQEGLKHSPNSRALKGLQKDIQEAIHKQKGPQESSNTP